MPYKPFTLEKKYFTIGEIAGELNVETSAIRFWEEEFKRWVTPARRKGNRRAYDRETRKKMHHIHFLLYNERYTLEGARRQIDLVGFNREVYESRYIDLAKQLA